MNPNMMWVRVGWRKLAEFFFVLWEWMSLGKTQAQVMGEI